MNISKEYIAGFFDGEGCVYRVRTNFYSIAISQKIQEPLIEIQKVYGGNITYQAKYNFYQLVLREDEKLRFLQEITPLLLVKKNQALDALHCYQHKVLSKQGRPRKTEIAHAPENPPKNC